MSTQPELLRGRLLRQNWPQQFRPHEPAPESREEDRRETEHDGIHQETRANHPDLQKPVAEAEEIWARIPAPNAKPTTLPLNGPRIPQA